MDPGVGLVLVAIGAICAWAVEVEIPGIDIAKVGVVLMVVGAVWLIWSAIDAAERRDEDKLLQDLKSFRRRYRSGRD